MSVPASKPLARMLAELRPVLRPGCFVFATLARVPAPLTPVASVVEDEGTTIVVAEEVADTYGVVHGPPMAMVTLTVHSELDAIGLTAAVSGVLADAAIPCNVVAGYYHDHLFVPFARAAEAMRVLSALSAAHALEG